MKQYVTAVCIPEKSEISKNEVVDNIKDIFYNDSSRDMGDVVLVDYSSLSGESKYKESVGIQSSIVESLDSFIITPETVENQETRKCLIKALDANNKVISSNQNRKFGINFLCLSTGKETEIQKQALRMILEQYNYTCLYYFDRSKLKENLTANINSVMQAKEVITNTYKTFEDIMKGMFETFVKTDNEYTKNHVSTVAAIAVQIAKKMGYEGEELDAVLLSAVFHDFGKQYIPATIINKNSSLSEDEFEIMKTHTSIGASKLKEILRDKNYTFLDHIINTCEQHHERADGKGYPVGLKDDEIDPVAKIVSVADAFQAMLGRAYKSAQKYDNIVQELEKCSRKDENGNQQFNREVVEALLQVLKDKELNKKMGISVDKKTGEVSYEAPTIKDLNVGRIDIR